MVSKLAESNIRIDYNHEFSSDTIPLPATTIYNLSDRLVQNQNIKINF